MDVYFITTGGTIDKVYFDMKSRFEIGDSLLPQMLSEANVTLEHDVIQLMRKDSLDMTDEDRALIRETIAEHPGKRFVVTHGTDTMAHTALAVTGIPDKTIVFTGALSPSRFRGSDAVFNLGAALAAVQSLPVGTYLCMNGQVFSPDDVQKNRDKNCFERIKAKK